MTNQEILDNAPEGATHCKDKPSKSDTVFYYKVDAFCWYFWDGNKWLTYHECLTFMRSLVDIKRIVGLEQWKKNACKRLEGLSDSIGGYVKRIAELEVEIAKLRNGNDVYFDENTLEQDNG